MLKVAGPGEAAPIDPWGNVAEVDDDSRYWRWWPGVFFTTMFLRIAAVRRLGR